MKLWLHGGSIEGRSGAQLAFCRSGRSGTAYAAHSILRSAVRENDVALLRSLRCSSAH